MKTWLIFSLVVGLMMIVSFVFSEMIITENIYFTSLSELPIESIESILTFQQRWKWVGYAVLPLVYLLKFTFVSLCLLTATFIFNISVSFSTVFRVAVVGEFVFVLQNIIRLCYFAWLTDDYTLLDIQAFAPLSLATWLLTNSEVSQWYFYPMQTASLFEVLYWVALAYGLHRTTQHTFDDSFACVLSGYGSGLLLWLSVLVFFNISAQ